MRNSHFDHWDDWDDWDDWDKEEDSFFKGFWLTGAIMALLTLVVYLAFFGGLIWLVFFLLNKYGVI